MTVATIGQVPNPYLEELTQAGFKPNDKGLHRGLFSDFSNMRSYERRHELVAKYSWAIPNQEAIDALVQHSPIVELGAGTGYWASLVAAAGGEIVCFDNRTFPGKEEGVWLYQDQPSYYPVAEGDESVLSAYPQHSLLLCWPNYHSSFASDALKAFQGQTVLFIGENEGGCTGDQAFFDLLDAQFEFVESVNIPQYYGIRDGLMIFRRKQHAPIQ